MQQFVTDALRTEPSMEIPMQRLQNETTVRLLHCAMGMATEAGEFLDMLKKHIFYGKPLDDANAIEEIGDSTWYERVACDVLLVQYEEMLARNVRKLRMRFPEKFEESSALNRNLDGERKIVEGKQ